MKLIVTILRDMLILGVLGVAIALSVNGARAKGSVKLTKAYFVLASPTNTPIVSDKSPLVTPNVETGKTGAITEPAGAANVLTESDEPLVQRLAAMSDRPLEQGFKVVTFEEVVSIFDDPGTEMDANIFVDARSDDAFEEGHIPGALQAYHYELERYMDTVMPYVESADIVVVYCNGGDCEDSGLVCGDLNEAGVNHDRLYLFKGGWEEWTANGMSVETGRAIAIGEEE